MPKSIVESKINFTTFLAGLFILISQISCKPTLPNQRIVIASAGKISSLDPAQASTFHTLQLLSALGDTLYKINEYGELIPILAKEKPRISNNGLTISIPLREGVLFHDGTRFDSEAMVFSINRF